MESVGEGLVFEYGLVEEVIGRIVDTFSPERIIIFGSVARYEAGEHSDLDILVVMSTNLKGAKREAAVHRAIADIRLPVDVFVLTPEEFDDNKDNRFSFASEIVRSGRVAYES